ncbi:MAG: hypothetical protein OHK0013_19020 [Sandaracinaceae bacterium]
MIRSIPSLLAGLLAAGVLSVLASGASAQPRGARLFPFQAPIEEAADPAAPGYQGALVRLPISTEVLRDARPDLSDVRVYDAAGQEVPFAIDHGDLPPTDTPASPPRLVVPYDASERTTRTAGVVTSTESYRLRPFAPPRAGGVWELVIEADVPELLRRITVRAEPPLGNPREVSTGAIFRFAGGSERMRVRLVDVSDDPIVVELAGEGPPLHPRFSLREVDRVFGAPPTAPVMLSVRAQRREGTRTILEVDRPPGLRTETLVIDASTVSFVRPIEVTSTTPASGRVVLARTQVRRIAGLEAPELLRVGLAPGGGDTLEIAIDDGDSPPLEGLVLTAEARVPALLFDAGRARWLRWGGSRARAARYDLMTTDVPDLVRGRALIAGVLGPAQPNPDYDATPALGFAMRAGQPVALARYTHRAPLAVPRSADGLSAFRVPPALFAEAREDLADLRVVDAEGRQWPHLFGYAPSEDAIEVAIAPSETDPDDPRISRHRVSLPHRTASATLLRASLPAQLVARRVVVYGTTELGRDVVLGETFWSNPADAEARLEVSLFGERVTAMWLAIDNGDEAPLPLTTGTLVQPGHEVFLVAPEGRYDVVVGDLDAQMPTYDVEQARDLVLVLDAAPATIGEVAANPAFREPTFFERSGWETIVLSAVLGLVVLVLFVVTLRVARTADAEPRPASTSESQTGDVASRPATSQASSTESEPSSGSESDPVA